MSNCGKKTATANTANATQAFICFDVFFLMLFFNVLMVLICFDDLFLMDFSKKSGKHSEIVRKMRVRDR